MKSILKVFSFCLVLCTVLGNVEAQTPVYKCVATSNYAFGVGWSDTEVHAAQRALYECALRTPLGDTCYIRSCTRVE